MAGLDEWIAQSSDGTTLLIVMAVAAVLGLRHATDPDHLAAVTTLIASSDDRSGRTARRLGLIWGLGHATTLFAFGLPIVLYAAHLPEPVQQGAETAIAFVIAYLAVRLILRWRRGLFAVQQEHSHPHRGRTKLGAFGIGLIHGMGGSAGVGILLVASIESQALSVLALALLAVFTAVSMAMLSTGFGAALSTRPLRASIGVLAPALGLASFGFAVWYGAAAWALAPYPF
jgi:High-affinity nickel-transport protein